MRPIDSLDKTLTSIRAALFWEQQRQQRTGDKGPPGAPPRFVTISRQAGAGGRSFAQRLAQRLNVLDGGERPWQVWDRELVERVAAEQHIPESLVESLEHPRSWVEEFLAGLSCDGDDLDQFQVYRKVATTIRGLARAGRAVIVGRGGVYATRDLPGGVHVRLVAPLDMRISHMAMILNVPDAEAAREVRRIDHEREVFHRRYWAGKALLPEIFTATFNTVDVGDEQLVASVVPLVSGADRSAPASDAPPKQPAEGAVACAK